MKQGIDLTFFYNKKKKCYIHNILTTNLKCEAIMSGQISNISYGFKLKIITTYYL